MSSGKTLLELRTEDLQQLDLKIDGYTRRGEIAPHELLHVKEWLTLEVRRLKREETQCLRDGSPIARFYRTARE